MSFGSTVMRRSRAGVFFPLEGVGAQATGMGGAFIGVADDATAASLNPAGLSELLVSEASLVLTERIPEIPQGPNFD